MRNTFAYNFGCRETKASKKTGLAPIELVFSINHERACINLPYKAKPSDFQRKRKPKEIEDYLNIQRATINKVITDMAENGIPLTANNLRTYYRTGGVKKYSASDLFDEYLSILKERVGTTITEGVYRKYELVRDVFFEGFDKEQEVTAITNSVVMKFFSKLDARYQNSTSVGMKTKFKTIVTFGMDNNRIKVNPFQGVKIVKEKHDIVFLTNEEIKKIVETPIENKSLSMVRDIFVLQLSSGLAYADVCALKKEDIKIAADGTHFIVKPRVKTGNVYSTVILKEGVDVLKKHNYEIKVISNQKMNAYLHVIQDLCGIEKNLTTHLARHTFAQRLLSSGVRLETVSKTLGHANTAITQSFYCSIRPNDVINEVNRVMG